MPRAPRRKLLPRLLFAVLLSTLALVTAASLTVGIDGERYVVTQLAAPPAPVALVFGAGLVAKDQPSPVLAARLDTALALYRAGKVRKLLLSGDNSDRTHDETRAMRRYVIDRGVPVADAVGDFAGLSTWDSCVRAKDLFGVDRALLVTQHFHLARALYLARSLGMEAWGVAADEDRRGLDPYLLREFLARAVAWGMARVRPEPKIKGEPLPIQVPHP